MPVRAQAYGTPGAVEAHGRVQRVRGLAPCRVRGGLPEGRGEARAGQGQLANDARGHGLARRVEHPGLELRRPRLTGSPGQQASFAGLTREQHGAARAALERRGQLRRGALQHPRGHRGQGFARLRHVGQGAGQPRGGVHQHRAGLPGQGEQLPDAGLPLTPHARLARGLVRHQELAQRGQPPQALQDDGRLQPEVDEARHLVHVRGAHVAQPLEATVHRADEAGALGVVLEGVLQQCVDVLLRDLVEFALVSLGRQQRRGDVRGAAEVAEQRLAHLPEDLRFVVPQERVQHAGDVAASRVAVAAPRLAVERHLGLQLLQRVGEEAGEHARAQLSREAEGLRVSGGREPHGQLRLHGLRPQAHLHGDAVAARAPLALSAPQGPQRLQVAQEDVAPVGVVLGREGEVLDVPAGGHRHVHAALGQVVHHGPLLRDEQRIMQGQHDAAGAQAQVLRDGGERGGDHRGLRVEATEGMEVTLRRPHGGEAIRVRELRALHQQLVLGPGQRVLVVGEVGEAEL
ncbi:hypothetical protein COSO111634_20880 [Corallococcus soli]